MARDIRDRSHWMEMGSDGMNESMDLRKAATVRTATPCARMGWVSMRSVGAELVRDAVGGYLSIGSIISMRILRFISRNINT